MNARSTVLLPREAPHAHAHAPSGERGFAGRLGALIELTKPRINLMVLLTVAVGYQLGDNRGQGWVGLLAVVLGTGLISASASAWNQLLERDRDARMRRTRHRPLPSGRLTPLEAALFATALGALGTVVLLASSQVLAAWVALLTFVLYVAAYTPLKGISTVNTIVGAVPGALPPVIGWCAATGSLGMEAFALFAILFLWQFPHFLAIAWLYREDYVLGGLKMLPVLDPSGGMTGRQAVLYALALLPIGLLPAALGMAGWLYGLVALLAGLYYLAAACRFWTALSDSAARTLLRASFIHLPVVLLLLVLGPAIG